VDEEHFRSRVYMAAVCRCFPGKTKHGGDRVPNRLEIENCSTWMAAEFALIEPGLVIPVGRLAIEQLLGKGTKLADVVGRQLDVTCFGQRFDLIALPHPSGLSAWHKTEPGKTLLARALERIANHPLWQEIKA